MQALNVDIFMGESVFLDKYWTFSILNVGYTMSPVRVAKRTETARGVGCMHKQTNSMYFLDVPVYGLWPTICAFICVFKSANICRIRFS
jgi:hypothetical protein